MGSGLFSQLDLGKRSLMAQQAGINVAGHNIANVNNEGYSRQMAELETQHPVGSQFGSGVDVQRVSRVTDRFLTQRLIAEQSKSGSLQIQEEGLKQLEALFADVEGHGLRAAFNEFWSAWARLANAPETEIYRQDLVQTSSNLAERISTLAENFQQLRMELNGRIAEKVNRVNELANQLAELNARVQTADRGGGETNDLADAREVLLKEMSALVRIDWYESDENLVHVNVGNGWPLVNGRRTNPLEASFDSGEAGMFSLKGMDPQGHGRDLSKTIKSGELQELVSLRDGTVRHFMDKLDELAFGLANQVNKIHSDGTGLNSPFHRLDSSFALKPDALANPLPLLTDGLFRMHLVDQGGELLETYEVEIQAGRDTLPQIVERINTTVDDPGIFRAVLKQDGSVGLEASGAYNFILGADETGFATMMGFNNFFESLEGARDFRMNERIRRNPSQISTGTMLVPGDNTKALAISELQFSPTMEGQTITFDEYYNGMMADMGLRLNRAQEDKRNQELIQDQFQKLRNETSSVNMDEEVADMVQYQRGFDAAAKFVSTIDEMTQTIVNI